MADKEEILLENYVEYIKKLAKDESSEFFSNGGIRYASELMAVLLDNTKREARLFCQGFKPELITSEPYWDALKRFLEDKSKSLKVLVESGDYAADEPISLLKQKKSERNDESIKIRIINEAEKVKIFNSFKGKDCNFAIFDDNKFRFEYEPNGYKAFGSFNHPDNAKVLIDLFDGAFNNSSDLN